MYLADFGFAKNNNEVYNEKAGLGTRLYASINTHLDISQSRRDDLESIGYVLMLFQSGSLPWYNSPNDWKIIGDIKKRTTVENLYRGCFKEFHYCRGRRFDEKPDYGSLKKLFR